MPALHKNRAQIREIFRREMNLPDLGGTPQDLADAARRFLREKFLRVKTAVSGANFLVAETGSVCIVESEGNGRMCLTLPETLISVAGIDKVIPRYQDLEVMLQLLPRSATGERMNPYNSIWTGVDKAPTGGDGPRNFHVVLMDNARTEILADEEARQTLHCIRCGACQNACPVYQQTGGHAYGSVYAGPIGAILTPQLMEMHHAQSLPYASSLCGACYEVCPVKINIPEVLIHLRNKVVKQQSSGLNILANPEVMALKAVALVFRSEARLPRIAEAGTDGGVAALAQGRSGRGLDRLAARNAGRLDAGARPARDAEADVSRVVRAALQRRGRAGEAEDAAGKEGGRWALKRLQFLRARKCCGGFARRSAMLPRPTPRRSTPSGRRCRATTSAPRRWSARPSWSCSKTGCATTTPMWCG